MAGIAFNFDDDGNLVDTTPAKPRPPREIHTTFDAWGRVTSTSVVLDDE